MALISEPPKSPVDTLPSAAGRAVAVASEWRNFFVAVYNICNGLTMSGTTANRPTTFLWTGRTYFDTSLGLPIFWNSSIWIQADGTPA